MTSDSAIQGNRKRRRPDAVDHVLATLMHPGAETVLISERSVLLTVRIIAWNEKIRLQHERRLRDRQRQNTNRILYHGVYGDHGRNRRQNYGQYEIENSILLPRHRAAGTPYY